MSEFCACDCCGEYAECEVYLDVEADECVTVCDDCVEVLREAQP